MCLVVLLCVSHVENKGYFTLLYFIKHSLLTIGTKLQTIVSYIFYFQLTFSFKNLSETLFVIEQRRLVREGSTLLRPLCGLNSRPT